MRHEHRRIVPAALAVVGDPGDHWIVVDEDTVHIQPLLIIENQRYRDHRLPGEVYVGEHAAVHHAFGLRLRHA